MPKRANGRPRNLAARSLLLEHVAKGRSVAEIIRLTSLSRSRVRHYLTSMVGESLILPSPYFSHLDVDGAGAKRFTLTPEGERALRYLRSLRPETPRERAGLLAEKGVSGIAHTGTPRYPGRYAGPHANTFRTVYERPMDRHFPWARTQPMRSGWLKRYGRLYGVGIEENNGATLIFRVPRLLARGDPLRSERLVLAKVDRVRRALESEYGCQLSTPVRATLPKHSFLHDPLVHAARLAGLAPRRAVDERDNTANDDSPEQDTLEHASAEAAREYEAGRKLDASVASTRTVGRQFLRVDERLVRMEEAVGRMEMAVARGTEASERIAGAVERLAERLTPPKAPTPPPPLTEPWESGYG